MYLTKMQFLWKLLLAEIVCVLLYLEFISGVQGACDECVSFRGYTKLIQVGFFSNYYYVFNVEEKKFLIPYEAVPIALQGIEQNLLVFIDTKKSDFSITGKTYKPHQAEISEMLEEKHLKEHQKKSYRAI